MTWTIAHSFEFDGHRIACDVLGDGKPLVLVHGTPLSSYVWHRIVPELAKVRRVYFYDLLGYGESEKREGQDVSLGVQNEVFAAQLSHWGVAQPDVIPHDFGGATVLRAYFLDGCDYRRRRTGFCSRIKPAKARETVRC